MGMVLLHHMGITVSDTDSAVAFYSGVSGGRVDGPYVKSGPAVDAVTGAAGAEIVQTFIVLGGDSVVELLEYRGVDNARIDPNNSHIGAAHPAFVVDDIDATISLARTLGYEPTSPPQTAGPGPIEGYRYAYIVGPDDVRVEVLQAPTP